MSSEHLFKITDGPSLDSLFASSRYRQKFTLLEFTITNTVSGEEELVKGYIDGMVETSPVGRQSRWFIRVVVQAGLRRHFYYNSSGREGFELSPDHPICQLEQFLYR